MQPGIWEERQLFAAIEVARARQAVLERVVLALAAKADDDTKAIIREHIAREAEDYRPLMARSAEDAEGLREAARNMADRIDLALDGQLPNGALRPGPVESYILPDQEP